MATLPEPMKYILDLQIISCITRVSIITIKLLKQTDYKLMPQRGPLRILSQNDRIQTRNRMEEF